MYYELLHLACEIPLYCSSSWFVLIAIEYSFMGYTTEYSSVPLLGAFGFPLWGCRARIWSHCDPALLDE